MFDWGKRAKGNETQGLDKEFHNKEVPLTKVGMAN
jgi:hypothetical protein